MAQVRTLDGNILSWVKNEIDSTMAQARQALEAHVETPEDESQLRFCLNYLHQVYGTLQMVELYGGSMLAEELERLIQALIDNKVTQKEESYEVLMRGMMQLPDYLEKLQSGQPDYPIVLLPLLNDLRACRNAGLLTESALFSPNLEVDAPIPMERVEQPIDTLARKLRHAYHLGLLDWFRNNDIKTGLTKISAVIEKMRHASSEPGASRMLWAASGVIEALQDRGIDSTVAVKLLFGQLDRQFKKLIDQGEFALSNEPPQDLLKNLLYYVASSNSKGNRVNELKHAFHLQNVMPDKETLMQARADLTAPNAALMNTVSSVMLDDLVSIKDTLDVFLRSQERNPRTLADIATRLSQMGDTLGMLGFGDQRRILQDQITVLNEMASGKRGIAESDLMDVASALLTIETTLTQPTSKPEAGAADAAPDTMFRDPEQRKLIKRVVEEAKVDLSQIKEAFHEYGRQPKQLQLLKDVPILLDRIRGSLSIMSLDRAAQILKAAAGYIQQKILSPAVKPESRQLELLADAISSVEYYLESLVENWGHPTSILEVAEQSLRDLGIDPAAMATNIGGEMLDTGDAGDENQTLVDLPVPDGAQGQDATLQMTAPEIDIGTASTDTADDTAQLMLEGYDDIQQIEGVPAGIMTHGGEIEEPEVEGSISQEFNLPMFDKKADEVAKAQQAVAPVAVMPPTAAQKSTLADELDDEIVEIFLEEAEEEYTNISRLLPAWSNHPDDENSLKELRRSFHTLKGSGRLVGAVDVGEFAWSFENMLNRIIDHTVAVTPEMFELLDKGRHQLPVLLKLFRAGAKPGQDVYMLMAQAEALSQGKPIGTARIPETKPETSATPRTSSTVQQPTEPEIIEDTTLAAQNETVADEADMFDLSGQQSANATDSAELKFELEEIDLSSLVDNPADTQSASSDEVPLEDIDLMSLADLPQPEELQLNTELPFDVTEDILETTEIIPLPPPNIDPVLLDIYRKEIATHLESLREYISQWYDKKDRSANNKLIRALHTIKGSSRTANVQEIADVCGLLEEHVRDLQDNKLPVNDELVILLQECDQFIEHTVNALDTPGAIVPDNSRLLARAAQLLDSVQRKPASFDDIELTAPEITVLEPSIEAEPVPDVNASMQVQDLIESPVSDDEFETDAVPDYDTELLEIFLEEGGDILNDSDHTLHAWIDEPDEKDHVRALQRQLHTLKGGARMAGVGEIGDLSHSIETMLTAIAEHDLPVTDQMFRVLQRAQDRLVHMLDIVKNNRVPSQAIRLIDAINKLSRGQAIDESFLADNSKTATVKTEPMVMEPVTIPEVQESHFDLPLVDTTTTDQELIDVDLRGLTLPEEDTGAALETEPVSFPSEDTLITTEVSEAAEADELAETRTTDAAAQQRQRNELVRVRANLLDNLVNFAGEVSIYRSRMEQQTNSFRYNLKELDDTVDRLREQLRKFEIEAETQIQFRYEGSTTAHAGFDPLEMDRFTQMQTLSRGMMESLNDLDSLRGILTNLTRESETLLLQQSRVNTELQEGLMRTRMVPISGQVPRLRRIVRQAADELGKQAELEIHGADHELDRTVLERVMSPIEHMLRNAVAHGIESPDKRQQAGKPAMGTVRLSFTREASDIVISVNDDGAGINYDAIRNKAIERGRIKPGAAVKKEELLGFILEPGFSTAEKVTQISGRGVGMDVVNNEIKQLGGHLEIRSEENQGTHFRISMPVSLSVARALMVNVHEEVFAIPLIGVETVERVTRDDIIRIQNETNPVYRWLENDYQYIHLSSLLGLTEMRAPTEEQRRVPLLLVRSGEYRAAIQVDNLIGSREIVVKPVGPQLSTLRGISGATIMGDGGVVLILDLAVLIRVVATAQETVATDLEAAPQIDEVAPIAVAEAPEHKQPLVMVVDDSITVRKVTTRFLERNNFRTISAKDGVDALTVLQEHKPDIMLLDVEMPRMDGFELATNIRNDANLKTLPIIMITSRTGQKHRDRALEIGVNIYMGKPYSEAELLDNIERLLSS